MDDVHIFANKEESPKKSSSKGMVLSFLVFFALIALVGGSYYIGRTSVKGVKTEAPVSLSREVNQIVETSASPSTTPTPLVTQTGSPSPTLKGSPTPSTFSKTLLLKSKSDLEGFTGSASPPSITEDIQFGKKSGTIVRGFVAFDLTAVPQGTKVGKAMLRLYQVEVKGYPFSDLGAMKIDHLNYGDSLDTSDYALAALSSSFATLPQSGASSWKEIDVTGKLKDDIANARSFSQYRLHFSVEKAGNGSQDDATIHFESSRNTHKTGNSPQLVVSY